MDDRVVAFGRRRGRGPDWKKIVPAALTVLGVASAGLYLYRDARDVAADFGPAEGSLRLNVNTASADELATVPGIGERMATLIVANRPYATVDDLVRLSGIGQSQVDSWRPFLKTDGDTETLPAK